jgi:diguanylate cyclase (GGDEF)-like protein
MKIEKSSPVRGARGVAAAYRRPVGSNVETVERPSASADVLGIPESEFTPRVRDAIMTLMNEVDMLRRELRQARQRLDDVEREADQDDLLPLLNRRAFVRETTRTIALARRYGTPASLIYLDLNDFKAINDSCGHAGGDAVLRHVAQLLSDNVRDSDVVGRLGGDEFGILLSHANQDVAQSKAESLASKLAASPVNLNGQAVACSFAYGAFELKGGDDADIAIARADEAMYANKRAAR